MTQRNVSRDGARSVWRVVPLVLAGAGAVSCSVVLGLDDFHNCPEDVSCPTGGTGGAGTGGTGGAEPTPTCTDAKRNGVETGVDCGGGTCGPCADGQGCVVGTDCTSLVCKSGTCAAATCSDELKNGQETDTDCGGPTCGKCAVGAACGAGEDCESGVCDGGKCVLPTTWGKLFGDGGQQTVGATATDAQGNVYVAGVYDGTLAFDPAKPLLASGTDVYLVKLDAQGKVLWSKSFPATGTVAISAMATDKDGNVGLVGTRDGTVDFGNGSSVPFGVAAFGAKFDAAGTRIWDNSMHEAEVEAQPSLTFDAAGNMIVFGFSGSQTSEPPMNCWLRARGPSGSPLGLTSFGGGGYNLHVTPRAVGIGPVNDIYVAGTFSGTATFSTGNLVSAGGSNDVFVAHFSDIDHFDKVTRYGDSADQSLAGMNVDAEGNIVLLGSFAGTINFGSPADARTTAGKNDIFVAKLSSTMSHVWSKSFGDAEDQAPTRLAIDKVGDIFFTGRTSGSVDFGGGALMGGGGFDIPLVKLKPDGSHVWSKVFGDAADQVGLGLGAAPDLGVFLAGNVLGSVDVGTGTLTSAGQNDILVARFAP